MRPRFKRIAIFAYDGMDEGDFTGVYGPLAKAAQSPEGRELLALSVFALDDTVRTSGGLVIGFALPPVRDLQSEDILVLPGGSAARSKAPADAAAVEIKKFWALERPVYAVCSGIFLLAHLGLLNGRRAAVHHSHRAELERIAGCRTAEGLTRDGMLTTIGGIQFNPGTKATRTAYEILETFFPSLLEIVADRMEVPASTSSAAS